MRYVIFWTDTNFEDGTVSVKSEEILNFEEMMRRFTLLSTAKDGVLVIEPDKKKVVCNYRSEGKVMFNRYLLDTTLFVNGED